MSLKEGKSNIGPESRQGHQCFQMFHYIAAVAVAHSKVMLALKEH
jgi:hypothetical protein